ncbi:MAG: cytidylyltransferase domain-containing protein [Chthonomonadales bacterium]
MSMRVLGVITARGGSKGVPRKNLHSLGGKPLLAYTCVAALQSKRLSRVILTTEDDEIARTGRQWGVEVPFLRPMELALDTTPTLPVLQHAVTWLEERGDRYDAVCLLQPTNPLRPPEWIDKCIELLEERRADCVITVLPVPPEYNPHWVYFEHDGCLYLATGEKTPVPRRQDLPAAFHREGSVYVMRRDVLMEQNSLFGDCVVGYAVDPSVSVNIDGLEDFERAEELLAKAGFACVE